MRFTLRVVDELYKKLDRIANSRGISRNALIVEALWEYLGKQK